jgi:hypothetical protein
MVQLLFTVARYAVIQPASSSDKPKFGIIDVELSNVGSTIFRAT